MGSARRIRFPEDESQLSVVVCEIPSREDWTQEDLDILFFNKSEYNVVRQCAKVLSKEGEKQGLGKHLKDTFTEKSSDVQNKLNDWVTRGSGRRGLERWVNKEHGDLRQQDQFQVVMAVLQAQDEMLIEKKCVDTEKLRKVSHKATKKARQFARMMGKADVYALSHDVPSEESSLGGSSVTSNTGDTTAASTSTAETSDISMPRVDEIRGPEKKTNRYRFSFGRRRRKGDVEDPVERIA